ncbi:heavy metal translocating P-type ATPase [Roseibium aggregatum]|uniref:P-type Zn(2+) transporter n=1 Tax=Roseibium aggregatum TaxID=187304 RepID=A0A939J4E3_9HYPH|nr:heavy metal translocating P-type ATPase [Roseibium aggregatum]MBN9673483.1 heavy metal translocating P-type ATPase [Roseibium aggregatum]
MDRALRPVTELPLGDEALKRLEARVDIVHEGPERLRVKMPVLGLPALDTDHLCRLLRAILGVSSVRINPDAISVIVTHDGTQAARTRVLDRLANLRRETLKFRRIESDDGPNILHLAGRAALLAARPFLPPLLGNVLCAATIAPRVLKGAQSVATAGVTVELLDALAVGIGALRGQFGMALTTDTMMSTGEYLEETTMRHSGALLHELLMPNPETAWIDSEGGAVEVPFEQVRKGDLVIVQTGGLVPVDGVVHSGSAEINQASITGESVPVGKHPGDSVIAGSVVQSGQVKIEAQQVGDETTTALVASLIQQALDERSETERLAEKHADRQVYMTLGLGLATLLLTRDLRRLSSVFLVDYACPIKLSAPVAVRATMSEAVSRGVLIKGGPSIEKLAEADTFVFDKTGTLTHGTLSVTDVVSLEPKAWPEERLLALAASVEEHSHHPVANAIVRESKVRGTAHVSHGDVTFEVGLGLRADVAGDSFLIGSRHFLQTVEAIDFDPHTETAERLVQEGKMLLYMAYGGKPIGLVGLRDELREDACKTMERLHRAGIKRLVMLTGDRKTRAETFGRTLGFDEVHAELRPEDKSRILTELQAKGAKVAFVGDGINDAPALAAANVGFSMPQGADLAQASADIILLDDRIGAVADAREAADQAMRIISTNTTAALGINTGLFIAASTGHLSPVAAALLHNGSTIALLVHALLRAGLPQPRSAQNRLLP